MYDFVLYFKRESFAMFFSSYSSFEGIIHIEIQSYIICRQVISKFHKTRLDFKLFKDTNCLTESLYSYLYIFKDFQIEDPHKYLLNK